MNKKYVKLLLSLAAIVSTLIVMSVSANAFLTGDVNTDNIISADDARLILRTAVKLETLTEQQFRIADVNDDGQITANDARLVLRMSVDLEEKTHYYEKEILVPATCTTTGRMKLTCTECDDVYEKDTDALGHDWNIAKPTCTEDKYCKRENCPTNERVSKLGHTTGWGNCTNCSTFITEMYADQAVVIKASFNEATKEATTAYSFIQGTVGSASWLTIEAAKAKPYYENAKAAYQAAYDACGDIPELAKIKAYLAKNIENTTGIISQIDYIATAGYVDSSNYFALVDPIDNLNYINSDSIIDTNKKLTKEIKW